ncbi:L-rhamnose-binding lectin ELEL-1-like isoform X2 [Amphiura filiformis]
MTSKLPVVFVVVCALAAINRKVEAQEENPLCTPVKDEVLTNMVKDYAYQDCILRCFAEKLCCRINKSCNKGVTKNCLVCEHETLHLICDAGQTISVVSALYGRKSSTPCNAFDKPILTNDCSAADSLAKAQNQCNGLQTCDIKASNGVFGDPCVGTFKYLEMEYTCEDAN